MAVLATSGRLNGKAFGDMWRYRTMTAGAKSSPRSRKIAAAVYASQL